MTTMMITDIVLYFCLFCSAAVTALSLYCLFRNDKVYELRVEMLHQIFEFYDINWRLDKMHEITYGQMVRSFKPLKPEYYYKDSSFLTKPSDKPVPSFIQLNKK